MDLSWLQQRLPTSDPAIEQRFKRIHESLSAGVDLKRRVVEELRPTLLDNMGLLPAVRWITQETCSRAGLRYVELHPEEEPQLADDAAIMIFRLVQESLTNIVKHAHATDVRVEIATGPSEMTVSIADNGLGMDIERRDAVGSQGLATMRHRVRSFGGTIEIDTPPEGGTRVRARLPLALIARAPERTPAVAVAANQ
jgi:signal transduction histidine kinase